MVTDKVGKEIQVGSYIVYGHALGRCAGLRLGKILVIKPKVFQKFNYETREYENYNSAHFTIIGVDDDWEHEKPKLLDRKSTLQFSERIMVLNPDQIPENIKNLLDNYEA